ncbi:MAG TPA: M1 family aminopeptidase [Candidatus Acidoferrum sp.]|nr:M1 family aminopeptidase [Candidatus Acidoferrum sp.]
MSQDPHALYSALNSLTPDGDHVFDVDNLAIDRDAIRIRLEEGKLALFEPIDGHVTGAVFSGQGHVVVEPRDAGERRSLSQFLGIPLIDQPFTSAYFRFTDVTADDIRKQLDDSDADESMDEAFGNDWARVAKDLNPAHSVRILEDLLSTDPLPYFSATLAGGPKGPVELILDFRREEQVLIGQPHEMNGESTFQVWASFPAAEGPTGDQPPSPLTFGPVDYHVETTIADDLSLKGTTVLHLKALRAGERVVPLELSKQLAVERAEQAGKTLAFFQNEDMSAREIHQKGNNFVYVVLPAAVRKGEDFQLALSYHGNVIVDSGNGVYFVGERGAWYAHSPNFGFFTPFELTFHWPKRLALVATGVEGKVAETADVRTAIWQSEKPFAVAGFNLGEYNTVSLGKSPVVRIYANKELESSIAARLHVTLPAAIPNLPTFIAPSLQQRDTVSVETEPMGMPADVIRELARQIDGSIRFYEKLNGPFPFDEMQVSPIPGSFGQGWPGLVYLSTLAFLPAEAQQQVGLAEKSQEQTTELMPFHEVAHQWWGNVTTAESYRDVWIEEAMATYQSLLYADARNPDAHRMEYWLGHFRDMLLTKPEGKNESIEQAGPLTLGYRLTTSASPSAYEIIVYDKGAWVMHMLRELMRDEKSKQPDARFDAFLQSVLIRYAYEPLTTSEFEAEAEKQMTPAMNLDGSGNLRWFFDQWVQGTGIPRYGVHFQAKPAGREFAVSGTLSQANVDDSFTERVPLYYSAGRGKLAYLGSIVTTGPQTHFHFLARERPDHLAIDPHMTVLCVTE